MRALVIMPPALYLGAPPINMPPPLPPTWGHPPAYTPASTWLNGIASRQELLSTAAAYLLEVQVHRSRTGPWVPARPQGGGRPQGGLQRSLSWLEGGGRGRSPGRGGAEPSCMQGQGPWG